MERNSDVERGVVDIDLIYSGNSNLGNVIREITTKLKERGYNVRALDEEVEVKKDARFRIYFFNKAFKKFQLSRYETMLYDKTLTKPCNSLVIARDAHTKYLPTDLSAMRLSVPLVAELTEKNALEKILQFLTDQEAQGREQDIQAFDREFSKLKEATDDFDFGRAFILVCNVKRPVPKNAESIATLSWLKVFDMSETTENRDGFFKVVQPCLTPGKFSITKISETPSKPEDDYTCWTVWESEDDGEYLFSYSNMLQEYCCGLKVPTVVVLWYPQNDELSYEVCSLITKLTFPFQGGIGASYILITDKVPLEGSPLDKLLPKQVRESNRIVVPLRIFFDWFGEQMKNRSRTELGSNLVPMISLDRDQSACLALTERTLNYLNHGMRLLTINEGEEGFKQLGDDEIGVNFLQGDLISWETIEDGRFDAIRELSSEIIRYVEEKHIAEGTSGIVKIHHHPGSGGTTLGRRVLWEMRKKVPCLSIDEWVDNTDNLRERIAHLRNLTHLPQILLMDGPVEADNILKVLPSERVVILHVSRYYGSMENKKNENGNFYLKEIVSKKDASNILPIYEEFGNHRCDELRQGTSGNKQRYLYEYGLMAFTDNFRGIREYVKGHLQKNDGEKNWNAVVELLALAKHYGNKSLPKQIFRKMLEKPDGSVVKKQDIGYLGRQLIQGDGDYWTIRYVEVAREILKQSLMKNSTLAPVGGQMLELTGSACENLRNMVILLIDTLHGCINKPQDIPSRILDILKDVFIMRHEIDDEGIGDKYKKYSMLLADVDTDDHREEIFQKLVERFPKHADFHAHLGRLYSHTKKFEQAEEELLEALKVRGQELSLYRNRFQEGDDTLTRIHHMLGTSYFERMQSIAKERESEGMSEIMQYAKRAIAQFEEARKCFTVASNQTYGFLSEVKVRLDVVNLAKEWNLLDSRVSNTDIQDFAARSFGISDRLLAQCAERADDNELKKSEFAVLVKKILEIFGFLTPLLDSFRKKSTGVSSRMCQLASLRNKHGVRGANTFGASKIPYENIVEMVSLLEELMKGTFERVPHRGVSTEMLEWLKLVRWLESPPSLEKVEKMVKSWDDRKERHSLSTFYLYVIYIAMALNYGGKSMSEIFRKKADALRGNLEKYKTTISRYQQHKSLEFLSSSSTTTVASLINREELGPEFYKDHTENQKRFRRCTGIVTEIKRWFGILHMDCSSGNPIDVFCAANRYKLTRQHAKEKVRVSFFMQFNPRHGAEAFDIAELQRCSSCNNEVEVRHYDVETTDASWNKCPKCGTACN